MVSPVPNIKKHHNLDPHCPRSIAMMNCARKSALATPLLLHGRTATCASQVTHALSLCTLSPYRTAHSLCNVTLVRLLLLCFSSMQTTSAALTSTLSRRAFSSSSPGSMERGFAHFINSCKRTFDRRATLAVYQEKQLFSPVPLPLRDLWHFFQLQMPHQTEIDLEEFLEGAQFAGKTQLMAANSKEFALFAAGQLPAQDKDSKSEVASQLEAICIPYTYRGLKEASKSAYEDKKLILEIQEIKVDKVFVAGIGYNQFTEQEYSDLIDGRATSLTKGRSPEATIEHLTIEVGAQTTEIHKMTLIGDEEALVEQQNYRRWLFESKVTTPDELEWRILAAHGINNSAKEIAPRTSVKESENQEGS